MRSALCLLASIAFMHLLAGCVGGVAVKPLECQSPYPLEDYVYTKDSFGPTKYFPDISPASNPRNKEDFRREFGEPDEIAAIDASREMWVYNRSAFCGIVPMWVIPVPLGLPVCDEFDHITFDNDLAVSIHFRRMDAAGAVIMLPVGGTGTGFHGCPAEQSSLDATRPPGPRPEVLVIPHTESCEKVAFREGEIWWSDADTLTRIDPQSHDILGATPTTDSNLPGDDRVAGFDSYWSVRKEKTKSYLSRFDLQSGQLFAFIPLAPGAIRVAVGFGSVWVLHEKLISRVDPQTNQVIATIALDNPVFGLGKLVVGEDAVWVAHALPRLLRVDPMSNQVTGTYEVTLDAELPENFYGIVDLAASRHRLWLLVYKSSSKFWSQGKLLIGLLEFDTTENVTRSTQALYYGNNWDIVRSTLTVAPGAVWACLPLGLYVIPAGETH